MIMKGIHRWLLQVFFMNICIIKLAQNTINKYDINSILKNYKSSFWTKRYALDNFEIQKFYVENDDDDVKANNFSLRLKKNIAYLCKFAETFENNIYTVSITINTSFSTNSIENALFDGEFSKFEKAYDGIEKFKFAIRDVNYCKNAYITTDKIIFGYAKNILILYSDHPNTLKSNITTSESLNICFNFAVWNEMQICAFNWLIQYLTSFKIETCIIFPNISLFYNTTNQTIKITLTMVYGENNINIDLEEMNINIQYICKSNLNTFNSICYIFDHGNFAYAASISTIPIYPYTYGFLDNLVLLFHVFRIKISCRSKLIRCNKQKCSNGRKILKKFVNKKDLLEYTKIIDKIDIIKDYNIDFKFNYRKYLFAASKTITNNLYKEIDFARNYFLHNFSICIMLYEILSFENVLHHFLYYICYIYCIDKEVMKSEKKISINNKKKILYNYEKLRMQILEHVKNSIIKFHNSDRNQFSVDNMLNIINGGFFDRKQQNLQFLSLFDILQLFENSANSKIVNNFSYIIENKHSPFFVNKNQIKPIENMLVFMAKEYKLIQINAQVNKLDTNTNYQNKTDNMPIENVDYVTLNMITLYQNLCDNNIVALDTIEMLIDMLNQHSKVMNYQKSLHEHKN